MKLWILRHGQAENITASDPERQLTAAGREEVLGMVALLAGQPLDAILASPYRRAQQTAALVRQQLGLRRGVTTAAGLTPEDDPLDVIDYLAERTETNLLLVSHQPLVGLLISLLVDGHRQGYYPMPTAGLACLEMDLPAAGVARLISLNSPAQM